MSYNLEKAKPLINELKETAEYITLLVGVKYENKDLAKHQGAKWDTELKTWYFKYILEDFMGNENLHTFQFKPFKIDISNNSGKQEIEKAKIISDCFQTAKNRHLKYAEYLFKMLNQELL